MDIDVSKFVRDACPRDFSASVAEIGKSAGADTWRAAMEEAEDTAMLKTAEELQAMRGFALSSGGWNEEEVNAWSAHELNALFIQWIAGDLRELGLDEGASWADVRELQKEGQGPSNLFEGDDGSIYFSLSRDY